MLRDAQGSAIKEGSMVRLVEVDPLWFGEQPEEARRILLKACEEPLEVEYFDEDDGTVSLILPPTIASDGDYVSNNLSIKAAEVVAA